MIGDPYEDLPASHAMHHATGEGPACWCSEDVRYQALRGLLFWAVVFLVIVGLVAIS